MYISLSHLRLRALAVVLLASIVLTINSISAQSPADDSMQKLLTTEVASKCVDYEYNAKKLIPRLYQEGKLDSVDLIIEFVKQQCCNVSFGRFVELRSYLAGNRPVDWCDTVAIREIMSRPGWEDCGTYFRFDRISIPPNECEDTYNLFLEKLADDLRLAVDSASIFHALALHFLKKDEEILEKLSRHEYPSTCLQDKYDSLTSSLKPHRNDFTANWGLSAGVWVPTGKLDVVGPKPEVGLTGGLRGHRFGADLTVLFRFLKSQGSNLIRHKDSLYSSRNFFNGYVGLEPNMRIYSSSKSSLELFTGIGVEGTEFLSKGDLHDDAGDYIHTPTFCLGFTQRLFYGVSHEMYVAIQGRYTILNYKNEGGTDLSGNAISLSIVWGGMHRAYAYDELQRLHYKD